MRRLGQRLGALAERDLLREVRRPCLRLPGKIGFTFRPDFVVRRLEPPPQQLALCTGDVSRFAPALLEVPVLPAYLLCIFQRLDRFHLLAELLLNPHVRPALPVRDIAQLLHLRRQRSLRRLEAADDLFEVALGRQRRNGAERDAYIFQRAFGGLQREIGAGRQWLEPRHQLLEARQRVATLALILLVGRSVPRRETRVGRGVTGRHGRIGRLGVAQGAPFTPDERELAPRGRKILDLDGLCSLFRQLGLPSAPPFILFSRGLFGGLAPRSRGGFLLLSPAGFRLFVCARPLGLFGASGLIGRLAYR